MLKSAGNPFLLLGVSPIVEKYNPRAYRKKQKTDPHVDLEHNQSLCRRPHLIQRRAYGRPFLMATDAFSLSTPLCCQPTPFYTTRGLLSSTFRRVQLGPLTFRGLDVPIPFWKKPRRLWNGISAGRAPSTTPRYMHISTKINLFSKKPYRHGSSHLFALWVDKVWIKKRN